MPPEGPWKARRSNSPAHVGRTRRATSSTGVMMSPASRSQDRQTVCLPHDRVPASRAWTSRSRGRAPPAGDRGSWREGPGRSLHRPPPYRVAGGGRPRAGRGPRPGRHRMLRHLRRHRAAGLSRGRRPWAGARRDPGYPGGDLRLPLPLRLQRGRPGPAPRRRPAGGPARLRLPSPPGPLRRRRRPGDGGRRGRSRGGHHVPAGGDGAPGVPARRTAAGSFGVEAVPPEGLAGAVAERTGGRGADLLVEASGNPEALGPALALLAHEGVALVCSWYGTRPASLPLGADFHRRRLAIRSTQVSTLAAAQTARWDRRRRAELAWRLARELPLRVLATHEFPFERAADAYARLDARPGDLVHAVLRYRVTPSVPPGTTEIR